MDLLGPEGILLSTATARATDDEDENGPTGGVPFSSASCAARANTIEGGTSDVMRNILGERILGLPGDLRADAGMPWKEIPRG